MAVVEPSLVEPFKLFLGLSCFRAIVRFWVTNLRGGMCLITSGTKSIQAGSRAQGKRLINFKTAVKSWYTLSCAVRLTSKLEREVKEGNKPGQAEVGQLDAVLWRDEHVSGRDVSVDELLGLEVGEGGRQLVGVEQQRRKFQSLPIVQLEQRLDKFWPSQ